MKVPAKKGLASHLYRVLHMRRRPGKEGGEQLKGSRKKHVPVGKIGEDVSTGTRSSRTTQVKRTQGTEWATGQTAQPEAISASTRLRDPSARVFSELEAKTKDSGKARVRRGGRGQRAWHARKGPLENLGGPSISCKTHGRKHPTNDKEAGEKDDWGVGSMRSTQRVGKPFTGGRH